MSHVCLRGFDVKIEHAGFTGKHRDGIVDARIELHLLFGDWPKPPLFAECAGSWNINTELIDVENKHIRIDPYNAFKAFIQKILSIQQAGKIRHRQNEVIPPLIEPRRDPVKKSIIKKSVLETLF